ncbi:nucleoside diphosphate-linked moiety X motif 17 isoform X7 [Ahaetulla prasina]|uniref:nucleoside diphosphate-linked moiety X motif 17 isoform X7 n=1 Tax=Ahaetulla prasina TaxID=499056 RepID=UPI002649FBF8|nr:nucleoside diphosphate-linked moiety X motif 17 isoform X7 [Ahaetulla prasina]
MLAGRRVAVHVCRAGGFPQRARFEQQLLAITASSSPTRPKVDSAFHPLYKSIVSHCCPPHEDGGIVHCALKSPQFLVSDREFPGSTGLLLKRPPFCPIKHLTAEQKASLPAETRRQGVDVGVAVLLESASAKLLLTRRARTLSLFPNTWVPPAAGCRAEGAAGRDRLAAEGWGILLATAGPLGVCVSPTAEPRFAPTAPHCGLPALGIAREPPAAPDKQAPAVVRLGEAQQSFARPG